MKIILSLVISAFCFSIVYPQDAADIAIQRLPLAKKKQISRLMAEIAYSTQIYLDSTDDEEIVVSSAQTIKKIRASAAKLPKGFFRDTLVSGAGAWEKSLFFRYDELGNAMLSLAKRKEIIEVYKLKDIAPQDRASRLFDFAQSFFDIAANVAVASGVPTK